MISRKVPLDQDCFLCMLSGSSFKIPLITVVNQLTHVYMHQNDSYCRAMSITLSNHYKCAFKATKSTFKRVKDICKLDMC